MDQYLGFVFVIVCTIVLYMSIWFLLSAYRRRTDVVDEAWGLGFVLISYLVILLSSPRVPIVILSFMVSVWGFRLFYHILKRHLRGSEDPRYLALTKNNSTSLLNRYFSIFMVQGALMLIIALPIINFGYYNLFFSDLGFINYLGLFIWLFGIIFESVADLQLKHFLASIENKGKIMMSGLWKYSRHPNYFGEIMVWWGVFLFTFMSTNIYLWLPAIVGPILITYLLAFVSGVPLAEKNFLARKDFEEYRKNTSVLIPWFKNK